MVVDYLKKTRDEFVKQQTNLIEKINTCENNLKENIQFVQMLEETNDPSYEAFTPREVNTFNRKKVAELLEERENITNQITELQSQLNMLDCNIYEINSVIKVAQKNISDLSNNYGNIDYETRLILLKTIEKERQRIARDLHDSTTQSLTSLVHKTELCAKLLDVDPIRCKLELFSVNKLLRDIIEETRRLIFDLRPMSFDDIGFDATLERVLDKFQTQDNIKCSYHVVGEPYSIDNVVQLTFMRVVQEACNNAVKHASASRLDVTLTYTDSELILTIADDGKGFDVDSVSASSRDDNSGFGMSIMKERVYLLSGTIDIQSSLGNGCAITVTIPIAKEKI